MAVKSKVYSVRLHPSDEREARVMEIIEELSKKGFSIREIFTDAILRADGYTPEMFQDKDERITRTYIETLLSEFGNELISQLGQGISIHQVPERPSPFDEDEDEETMRNIAQGFMNRRQRTK